MAADSSTLAACLETANAIETALNLLGDTSEWPADRPLRQRCAEFREACRELVEQKGLTQFAVAFLGPKNAGKTSLLSLLIRNPALSAQLHQGADLAGATERILWLSSQPLQALDPSVEDRIPVERGDLVNLSCDYTLIDVPGANEANRERGEAARRALRNAHLKVLVVEARTMEDVAVVDYIGEADGATILPVINQIRPDLDEANIDRLMDTFTRQLPQSRFLSPLRIPDFQLAGANEDEAKETARKELIERLQSVIRSEHLDELLVPQLRRMKQRFQEEMNEALLGALPATAEAARRFQASEDVLAAQALEKLLGEPENDRAVIAGLRQQLRADYQQRTPVLLVPWRLFVGVANLLHGALEKVPLLLAGSLPSLVTSAMTAVKNVARDREFTQKRDEGLRQHAELLVKECLKPQVEQLEAAIRSDLRHRTPSQKHEDLEVELEGLDLLQSRSSALFQRVLGEHSPHRGATLITGLVGTLVFWSLFIWPCLSLYQDYFQAIHGFVSDSPTRAEFPTESFAMLGTSFLLALLPMLLWLLVVLSWVASRSRAKDCLTGLREGHKVLIDELSEQQRLRARLRHPHLQACLRLFPREAADK